MKRTLAIILILLIGSLVFVTLNSPRTTQKELEKEYVNEHTDDIYEEES